MKTTFTLTLLTLVVALQPAPLRATEVKVERVPEGGLQPQVAVGTDGTLHLIYLKGELQAVDVYYVRRAANETAFSKPMRVNSQPGTAVAVGTIRGAQLALGRNNRVHVAWNGPHNMDKTAPPAPMLYARLNDAGTAFEPQRNVISAAYGLDGGGSIAADAKGNVYVTWHAPSPNAPPGELNRAVFVTRSQDDGKTFTAETKANREPTGACGCCGMKAFADPNGNLYALYRSAKTALDRDIYLLSARGGSADFALARVQAWKIGRCPMSSASLAEGPRGVLAAWETAEQVYFTRIEPGTAKFGPPVAPPGTPGNRKHPVVAGNAKGETLLAWTEGTGWKKGGALAWRLFDAAGQPVEVTGRRDGVPVWGLAAACADGRGDFLVFY
jgi:hypothetical protein